MRYPPSMDPADRRLHSRHELFALVRVRRGTIDHVASTINLSRGGALLDLGEESGPTWLKVGKEVDVGLLDAEGACLFETRASIVRISDVEGRRFFAVQFAAVQDEDVIRSACREAGRPPPLPPSGRSAPGASATDAPRGNRPPR